MSETHRLRKAQAELLDIITITIERAYEQSQIRSMPISDGKGPSGSVMADFFQRAFLDSRIGEAITNATGESFDIFSEGISLGSLLRKAKTLRKAKGWIRKTEEHLKGKQVNKSDLISASVRDAEIDYVKEIYHCLELIAILTQKSKRIQRKRNGYFLEYCALCWRLVNKNKILNYSDPADYSAYYCLEHHPKKSGSRYHSARTALFSAIDKSDRELKEELIRRRNENLLTPFFLYKSTARFAKKHPKMVLDAFYTGDSWKNRVSRIIEISKLYYPSASEAMKDIFIKDPVSWQEWFYAVIKSFDSSGIDAASWDDANVAWKSMSDDQAAISGDVGEDVLLNIIHRYESTCNIKAMPQPRGPKKGEVKKNDALRSEITILATRQIDEKNKINVNDIVEKLNVSRTLVYRLLKELGFQTGQMRPKNANETPHS